VTKEYIVSEENPRRFSEARWEKKGVALRESILPRDRETTIDLSSVTWFDLWPVTEFAKILRRRARAKLPPTTIQLPDWRAITNERTPQYKPLCFLVDIGLVSNATELGCRIAVGKTVVSLEVDSRTQSGLSERSLSRLEEFGYQRREYKDRIVLPLTVVRSGSQVEELRVRLWNFVKDSLPFYATELSDGAFIDTFFREIAENAIEHSQVGEAIVAARLVRSVADLPPDRRRQVAAVRNQGKCWPFLEFLKRYGDCGFLELLVVDDGVGIRRSLGEAYQLRDPNDIYRLAFDPEGSRYSSEERNSLGKSPLTGLGACVYNLSEIRAHLAFREGTEEILVFPSLTEPGESAVDFEVKRSGRRDPYKGCNAQFMMALEPRGEAGARPKIDLGVRATGSYVAVNPDWTAPPLRLSSGLRVPRRGRDSTEGSAGSTDFFLLDATNTSSDKDTVWHLAQSVVRHSHLRRRPVLVVGASRSLRGRLWEVARLVRERPKSPTSTPFAFVALSPSLHWFCISSESPLSLLAIGALEREGEAFGADVILRLRDSLHIVDDSGRLRFRPSEVVATWLQGLRAKLESALTSSGSVPIVLDDPVLLPGGARVRNYFDISTWLDNPEVDATLAVFLAQVISASEADVVVSYSATVRSLLTEAFSLLDGKPARLDLPDPFATAGELEDLKRHPGKRAILIADAVFRGNQVRRVVKVAEFHGLTVETIAALVDSRPAESRLETSPAVVSAVSHVLRQEDVDGSESLAVDPFTLCVEPRAPRQTVRWRTSASAADFYGTFQRHKALVFGHFASRHGYHLSAGLDLRQLLTRSVRQHIVDRLAEVLPADALCVAVEGAVIESLLRSLHETHGHISAVPIRAIPAREGISRFAIAHRDQQAIAEALASAGEIVVADDAYTSGRLLRDVGPTLLRLGATSLNFVCLVDNSSPFGAAPVRIADSMGRAASVDMNALFRTWSPVFESARDCPSCRMRRQLEDASSNSSNALLSAYLSSRADALGAVSLEQLMLGPERCRFIGRIEVAPAENEGSVPERVETAEALQWAVAEQVRSLSGVEWLAGLLERSEEPQQKEAILYWLSLAFPWLWRSGRVEALREFAVEEILRRTGEGASSILEMLLVWPIETIEDALEELAKHPKASLWVSDSGLALVHSLLNRLEREGGGAAASRVRKKLAATVGTLEDGTPEKEGILAVTSASQPSNGATAAVAWAWKILANRLLVQRSPHHRILVDELSKLGKMRLALVEVALGDLTADQGTSYLAVMLQLADVLRALRILVRENQLFEVSEATRISDSIERILQLRAAVRQARRASSGHSSLVATAEEVGEMAAIFQALHEALRADLPPALEGPVVTELRGRVLQAEREVFRRVQKTVQDWLEKSGLAGLSVDEDAALALSKCHVLADHSCIAEIAQSIGQNVSTWGLARTRRTLFEVAELLCAVADTEVTITVRNRTDGELDERGFAEGADALHLNQQLARYGGSYSGRVEEGYFVTRINLTRLS